MTRLAMLLGMLLTTACFVGCSESKSGLATDSGEMTLEAYEEQQKAEEAAIAESMKEPAK